MDTFRAPFEIISVRNCPLYSQDDCFLLTEKMLELPMGRLSCLILVRELTTLLFSLMPHVATNFAQQRDSIFTCGGCSGLIKFRLTDKPVANVAKKVLSTLQENSESAISGKIEAIVPAELLQVFHMHQKTGRLSMEFENGSARVPF